MTAILQKRMKCYTVGQKYTKNHNNVSLNAIQNYMSYLIIETAVGSSNIMPKPNLKTHVQAPKYICASLISSSFSKWRKESSEKTLNSVLVLLVSNSEVNSRSIDFKIFYILKQQFLESVYKSCEV